MKCEACGNEFQGNFCDKCGAKNGEGTVPTDLSKFNSVLMDPEEKVMAVLGNGTAQTYLTTGVLGNGFAILSNARVYFKGKCLIRKGKGFYRKMEEKTVDLNDVTGTGFVHNAATWMKVVHIIFLVLGVINLTSAPLALISGDMDDFARHLGASVLIFLISFAFKCLYDQNNYSAFEISYAGGGIAFDMHWVTSEESKEFQRQVVLLKQKVKEDSVKDRGTARVGTDLSVPEQLKQYKELLDTGVITQEEFDAKKKQLLGQ